MVFVMIMTDKDLIAAAQFFIETDKGVIMAVGIEKNGGVFVCLRSISMAQNVRPAGSD